MGRAYDLWWNAKVRDPKATITREWVKQKLDIGICEATGIPLDMTTGQGASPWCPTLDQILPGQGYRPDNVQVVCYIYNKAKAQWTHEDVLTLSRALLGVDALQEPQSSVR